MYLAIQFVLRAASKLRPVTDDINACKLAQVAERCNAWATRLAIEEAKRDYYRAYGNSTSIIDSESSPATATTTTTTPGVVYPNNANVTPGLLSPDNNNGNGCHYANCNYTTTMKRQRCDNDDSSSDEESFHSRTVRQCSG